MTHTHYDVRVNGRIWDGGPAWTTYRFDHKPTRAEVIEKAGDFSAVTAIRCKVVTTTFETVEVEA